MSFLITCRLREYESTVDESVRRGPEVERVYFVILELSRKYPQSSLTIFLPFLSCFHELWTFYRPLRIWFRLDVAAKSCLVNCYKLAGLGYNEAIKLMLAPHLI